MKTNNVKPKENNSTKPPLPFASLFIIVLLGIMAFIAIFFGTKDLGSVVITLALFWLAIPLLWIVSAVNMLSILYRDAYKSRQKRWGRLYMGIFLTMTFLLLAQAAYVYINYMKKDDKNLSSSEPIIRSASDAKFFEWNKAVSSQEAKSQIGISLYTPKLIPGKNIDVGDLHYGSEKKSWVITRITSEVPSKIYKNRLANFEITVEQYKSNGSSTETLCQVPSGSNIKCEIFNSKTVEAYILDQKEASIDFEGRLFTQYIVRKADTYIRIVEYQGGFSNNDELAKFLESFELI